MPPHLAMQDPSLFPGGLACQNVKNGMFSSRILSCPLSSVVERVTSTSRECGRPLANDEVGCSIQPAGTLFFFSYYILLSIFPVGELRAWYMKGRGGSPIVFVSDNVATVRRRLVTRM